MSNPDVKYAVAAIRVSTTKQGTDGDSPEAQKEQIERFAESRNIIIKKYFVFLESASKEQQPMQEAVDYCKNAKNGIELFVVKSIDRFTRGGSHSYDQMKMQLDACSVKLIDIYGVISAQEVNTLDHLGFEYNWSKYSPSKKSEILEAERAKDELRDIMSRMIGAEIRYTQMGYWMRQPPYGFVSEKVETNNGKRCVLAPHPTEADYVKTMFDMRAKGAYGDQEIVDKLNSLGFSTRVRYRRKKTDKNKIISKQGGSPLTVKAMHKLLKNPIYAGINAEKWTNNNPVRCVFDGLISVDLFNRANRGKKTIVENSQGAIKIYDKRPAEHLINKGSRNPDFPYRKFILCPQCNNPLTGSASRGKSGKHYPAYHCSNHGHYYRIPKEKLENTVRAFMSNLMVSGDQIDTVMEVVTAEWHVRNQGQLEELKGIESRIQELQTDAATTVQKIRVLSSPTVIKYMEEDLVRIEQQIENLKSEKEQKEAERPSDLQKVLGRVRYYLEHLDELLAKQINPIKKAQLFAVLFDKRPTYEDLELGTQKTPLITGVNQIFALAKMEKSLMVTPRGIEPLFPG